MGLWESIIELLITLYPEISSLFLGAVITLFIVERKKQADKRKAIIQSLKEQIEISMVPARLGDISDHKLFVTTPYWSQTFWMILNSDVLNHKRDAQLIRHLTHIVGAMENHNSLARITNLAIIMDSDLKERLCQEMITVNKLVRKDLESLKSML
ncbi:hypothetical protein QJQ58_15755 [Paenibacillus dendritiformis]|uniref:hypothetical protein n=1 Tax=Paenibacillus dendritiformis TaxID=130049 RepID=UPI00248B2F34|nr:hypothetical protein [Paenibacillus dendritiformis]WGU92067.1 hypothetical protein QJQ58_15755 [Paenibacillus dendritiformis]